MKTKTCTCCGEVKLVDRFHRKLASGDGRSHKCTDCVKAYRAIYNKTHREKQAAYDARYRKEHLEERAAYIAEYRKDPKHLAVESLGRKAYWARFPERYEANRAMYNAVRRGQIIRPGVCSACGRHCKPHGHHEDYNKPMEVIWLCACCHRATRKILRAELETPTPCTWTLDEDEGSWNGTCGCKWHFDDGGPSENRMRYCPDCGHPLRAEEAPDD
jgi:hypothetical protein